MRRRFVRSLLLLFMRRSKACVLSFSRALGQELREKSIYVTAVCPGPVETEFFEVSGELKNPLKKLNMAAANKVVHRALIDSRKKKSVSVYGAGIKAAEIMTKLLPVSLILKAEELFVS